MTLAKNADEPTRQALIAARVSYGRLLAWLAWQWRDIAAAEDALAEAFAAALEHWPLRGVPESPEAWLMTAAKRNLLTAARRRKLAEDPRLTAILESEQAAPDGPNVPDDRLRLMFVCTHPAIDVGMRSALMLQIVLGIEAARIAEAYLVSHETMTKRLVRAKSKIKANGIRFEEPDADEWAPRVHAVLEAIYGAYVVHGNQAPDDPRPVELGQDSLYLATLVATLLPQCSEALGLQALLLLCEARKPARLNEEGHFVPLDRQDPRRWHRPSIEHAWALLDQAALQRDPGPFQIEAAIQAAHCYRVNGGPTPWGDIVALYENLLILAPTIGARLGHAVAVAESKDDGIAGLQLLEAIDARTLTTHQSWWAVRAHLFTKTGNLVQAAEAYRHACALSKDEAVRRYLAEQMDAVRCRLH